MLKAFLAAHGFERLQIADRIDKEGHKIRRAAHLFAAGFLRNSQEHVQAHNHQKASGQCQGGDDW